MRLEVILESLVRRHPERVALVCGARRLTYGALQDSIRRVAAGLLASGIRPGDRIVAYLPNGVEFVQLVYGAFAIGAVVVPVTTRLAAPELAHIVADCRPRMLAFHAASAAAIDAVLESTPDIARLIVGGRMAGAHDFADVESGPARALPETDIGTDEAMIMYTSGTTGRPKGAIITHANNVCHHRFVHALEWGISGDDRYLVTTPLAHRAGFARCANALSLGGTAVIMEKFDPAAAIDLIEREAISVAGMVPTVCRMMLPHIEAAPSRCASLRRLIVTGEAFPIELKRKLIALLPELRLLSFLASTEAGTVTTLTHEEQFTHPESVGRPIPGVEVKLVDDAGAEVAPGNVGEILVRSGAPGRFTTMLGYLDRPEDNAAMMRTGWVPTGDLGRFDPEGYLYVVDRKKDMVLSGGLNVYAKEVEQALVAHAGVADAAVIGVPDPTFGEAVAAFVETAPGIRPTAAEIIDHCRKLIAGYKKPKYIVFVDSLPRNSLGKVVKQELRQQAAGLVLTNRAKAEQDE